MFTMTRSVCCVSLFLKYTNTGDSVDVSCFYTYIGPSRMHILLSQYLDLLNACNFRPIDRYLQYNIKET